LALHAEYNQVLGSFRYAVETERRYYLANHVDMHARNQASDVYFELTLDDVWVFDANRQNRYLKHAHIVTFKDVNIEELPQ
jgi:hypothetical protein